MNAARKIKLIVDGWRNLTFPSPEVERIAHERLAICAECPNFGWVCRKCGCKLSAKVRSTMDVCPIGKW